jgi:hypothetical protein
MPKSCPNCSASNKDEALFCKACGSSLADVFADTSAVAPGSVTCSDCGHVNRPGTHYCARCGVNMEGTVILPRSRGGPQAPAPETYYQPSADTYPSTQPFSAGGQAYAAAPAAAYSETEADDTLPPKQAEWEPEPPPPAPAPAPAAASSSSPLLWIVLIAAAALALGGGLWWFLSRPLTPPVSPEVKAPVEQVIPAPTAPVQDAAAAASAAAVAAAASAAEAAAAAATVPPVAETPPQAPVAATPDPSVGTVPPDPAREAAQRQAREKAARLKAETEAKAKLQVQQRDQEAARLKAEQEAAARRRADERQARPAATTPVAPVAPRTQTVNEICAGRNFISKSLCEVKECSSPAHSGEALCKTVLEREERRKAREQQMN